MIMSTCSPKSQFENLLPSQISDREQNIIRSVGGYIPFVLIKHYQKEKKFERIIRVLESFSEKNTDHQHFLDKTQGDGLIVLIKEDCLRFLILLSSFFEAWSMS